MNKEELQQAFNSGATHSYMGHVFNLNIEHLIRIDDGSILPIDLNNADYFKKYGVEPIDYSQLTTGPL